jgi:hypothetical protein
VRQTWATWVAAGQRSAATLLLGDAFLRER